MGVGEGRAERLRIAEVTANDLDAGGGEGSGTVAGRVTHRLKQWRGLAMRTDKLAIAYQAALHLATVLIWTAA
ncbi:hypothetical protein [Streptomyces phaeochromogenes]|uniref:hypothetical protein n=1 Tax=Streptomyces phaeochromogenes TaxID=1923 RepID=UPI00386A063F